MFFVGYFSYFLEKMSDNFQNTAGGQPLFRKTKKESFKLVGGCFSKGHNKIMSGDRNHVRRSSKDLMFNPG